MPTATLEESDRQPDIPGPEVRSDDGLAGVESRGLDDFGDLYAVYGPRVYYLCLRMTGNADDAEDLSQEAFLRMIQKLETFRGESPFYTWVRRLAINVVLLRFQKASWRHETSLEALLERDAMFDCGSRREFAATDLSLLGALDRIALERAMDQLPPGFKTVFVLHDIEGYDHAEISRLTGCSIGTSKSQLHKARIKMRELLGETPRQRAHPHLPQNGTGTARKASVKSPQLAPVLQSSRPAPCAYGLPYTKTS